MQNFFGKTALVIGGSGGIGASICKELSKKECSLIIHGSHESEKFNNLVDDLQKSTNVKKIIQHFDSGFVNNFSKSAINISAKEADIICICFGPFMQKKLHEMEVNNWEYVVNLNLLLPSLIISSALPHMMENKWGRFLLFGGTRTERINAFETNAAYAATKTAVSSLARSIALEYAKFGITSNVLFPGFTKTEYMSDELCGSLSEKMPQKRLINTAEVATLAMNLLEQPMVNGALVSIDGGWDPAF